MNSFQRFGIDHLSPSSLNLWRDSPGVWALKYIGKIKDEGSPKLWRGNAVEAGYAALLRGAPMAQALQIANDKYTSAAVDGSDAELIAEQRKLIAPMLTELLRWKA